jgi:hypothetical protein
MENEEGQQLTTAQHVESMLNSDGWKYAKEKFDQRILDLQNINNLDMTKSETVSIQILARKMAVDEMWAWIKGDVIGYVEQQKANSEKILEKGVDNFIDRV